VGFDNDALHKAVRRHSTKRLCLSLALLASSVSARHRTAALYYIPHQRRYIYIHRPRFYPLFHFTAFLLDDGVGGKFNTMILSPKPVTITFVNSAVSGLYPLYRQLPVPLLPLSFTPNLITVILSTYYINSLSVNYPVSSRSITLLIVLS